MKKFIPYLVITAAALAAATLYGNRTPGPKLVDLTDRGNGTIFDKHTGLTWQKCTVGHKGAACTGQPKKMTWSDAVTACSELELGGTGGWRLPTGPELSYIVDCNGLPHAPLPEGFSCGETAEVKYPLADEKFFPAARKFYYWAMKDDECSYPPDKCAAAIDFGDADNGKLRTGVNPDEKYYVRCVHGDFYSIWK